jgi:coiled-coil domain-containing protein 77
MLWKRRPNLGRAKLTAKRHPVSTLTYAWLQVLIVLADHRLRAQLEDAHAQHETLTLTIEALKAQLEDQARTSKEQVISLQPPATVGLSAVLSQMAALLDDRRVRQQEAKAKADRDSESIARMNEKLRHTQELLYDSTRDFLELKYTHG